MLDRFDFARAIPAIHDEPCTYTRKADASAHIVVDRPSSLNKLPPLPWRTERFSVLDAGPVRLRGFRAYTTPDRRFFLDESLDPNWNRDRFTERFVANGRFEDFEAQFRDDHILLPDLTPTETITDPIVALCSGEPANYGSWIYRILPKLATLPASDRALLIYHAAPWQKELLSVFAPDRRVIHHKPNQVYDLPDAQIATMRNLGVCFDDRTRAFYRDHAAAVPGTSDMRRIYLSRATQKIRPMRNEAELEAGLVQRGFHIVRPEALSLSDRIRVIRDAEVIVCPGGSGLFNLVFANNAKLVIDIEASRTWIAAHTRLMNSLELPHIVLLGQQDQTGQPHAPWAAPVDDAMWCLDQHL